MEFDEVVLGRRSIRGYKKDPVPMTLIKEVLSLAHALTILNEHSALEFYSRLRRNA